MWELTIAACSVHFNSHARGFQTLGEGVQPLCCAAECLAGIRAVLAVGGDRVLSSVVLPNHRPPEVDCKNGWSLSPLFDSRRDRSRSVVPRKSRNSMMEGCS